MHEPRLITRGVEGFIPGVRPSLISFRRTPLYLDATWRRSVALWLICATFLSELLGTDQYGPPPMFYRRSSFHAPRPCV